jgi:hypothetical protein
MKKVAYSQCLHRGGGIQCGLYCSGVTCGKRNGSVAGSYSGVSFFLWYSAMANQLVNINSNGGVVMMK